MSKGFAILSLEGKEPDVFVGTVKIGDDVTTKLHGNGLDIITCYTLTTIRLINKIGVSGVLSAVMTAIENANEVEEDNGKED